MIFFLNENANKNDNHLYKRDGDDMWENDVNADKYMSLGKQGSINLIISFIC